MATVTARRVSPALVERCHRSARAERWHVSSARLATALEASVARAFAGKSPTDRDIGDYVSALKLEDLALATACADGDDDAWDHVMKELRPALYRAADAIDPSGGARELADALWADMFGLKESGGVRMSLFRYFHGRSSLATWMRTVLSQRYVDALRSRRRNDDLPDDESPAAIVAQVGAPDPDRSRWIGLVRLVLSAALVALAPKDRLRLAFYYGQGLKLAAIGRLLGEHEATVSRHLTRTRSEIRDDVERRLKEEHALTPEGIRECLAMAVDEAGAIDMSGLGVFERKNDEADRSKERGGRGVERS